MKKFLKVDFQPAFVLHQKDFKNTSKIVDLLTRDFGRINVVANGVKKINSNLRKLKPFSLLKVSFQGKSDLKTLTFLEETNKNIKFEGVALYCGFYINELLLLSLPISEPFENIFYRYYETLFLLNTVNINIALRQFEYQLLKDLGFGFDVNLDKFNNKIIADKTYTFNNGLEPSNNKKAITGYCLQALIKTNFNDKKCLSKLKIFMQNQLDLLLQGQKIKSRELLNDYLKLTKN